MFAPQSSPAGRFEGQPPKTKDVVFCERSAYPLAVPSALVASIWEQVNEGLRAVPRGGAEVGGLLLGRQSQTGIVLAEEVVPIKIEYRFGPSFHLSDTDLHAIRSLMGSVQKDPSKAVVGFYRSRTRNDSRSQESDSELLAVLEQSHTSFASNFHYYIAFTPLSKLSMTASVSVRKEDGWDDWQHVTLRSNPMSPSDPIEFEAPPKAAPAPPPAPAFEQALARPPATPPPVAYAEPPQAFLDPYTPPQPPVRVSAHAENRQLSYPDRMMAISAAPEPKVRERRVALAWYVGGGVLLAAIGLGGYLRFAAQPQPRVTFSETPVAPQAPSEATVHTGFAAAREGPLWRLSWDRAAVAALNPTGAVLAIRDGGKEQQVGLSPSDLSSGTILYTPQTGDLLFSLNIVLPGSQLAEEHVRVLEPPHAEVPPPAAREEAEPVRIVSGSRSRALRPFPPVQGDAPLPSAKRPAAEIPPPPALAASSPASPGLPVSQTPTVPGARSAAANAPPGNLAALPPLSTAAPPASTTIAPKVLRRVNPTLSGPIPAGVNTDVQLHVDIDAHGVVTRVTPLTSTPDSFSLVEAATRAAKAWTFEPARAAGRPVAGEMILEFHFGQP